MGYRVKLLTVKVALGLFCLVNNYLQSSVVAAATEYYDDSEDYNPSAVIVEDMAKAVVIHNMFLRFINLAVIAAHFYNMQGLVFL